MADPCSRALVTPHPRALVTSKCPRHVPHPQVPSSRATLAWVTCYWSRATLSRDPYHASQVPDHVTEITRRRTRVTRGGHTGGRVTWRVRSGCESCRPSSPPPPPPSPPDPNRSAESAAQSQQHPPKVNEMSRDKSKVNTRHRKSREETVRATC
eukprot:91515-Rhodomonas_salina.1